MCHSGTDNNKINRLHERCLQIVYNDKLSSFNGLFEKDGSVSIHMRNIQILANKMYKLINNLSPPRIVKLNSDSCYNLRQTSVFQILGKIGIKYGIYSYFSPKIWDILTDEYKTIKNLDTFKIKIKQWKPENCLYRLCKVYIDRAGFLLKS